MGQIHEDFNTLLDDLMGTAAPNIGDEADAASVVLALRVVETLAFR